jgi:hypothetical protein
MCIYLFKVFVPVHDTSEFREILKLLLRNKTITDVANDLYIFKHINLMFMCGLGLSLYHSSHGKVVTFT